MQLDAPKFADLDAKIVKRSQSANAFHELRPLQLVDRTRHDVDLDATQMRPDEMLDHRRVLVTLVLQPQRMLAVIDEFAQALATVADTPDEVEWSPALKSVRFQSASKHSAISSHLVLVRGHDSVVTRGVKFAGSQFSDWTKAISSSITIDFSCVRSKCGLLSMT